MRLPPRFACLAATVASSAAIAQNAAFDLTGPTLTVTVARGGTKLPLAQVPALAPGDRLVVSLPPPPDRGSRYLVILAFLRGATSPPPPDWLLEARPWRTDQAKIDATVPTGAQQALLLLVPETGGAVKAVESALRGRPGAFVRAVQELNQASLDRTRLDTYLARAADRAAAGLPDATAELARNLAVKVDPACLARSAEVQTTCLGQGGGAAVLADAQTTSLAQNLAGAPADIALAVSSTPQASFGYYSSYIGLVRDVARLFGAFQSAQLQFIPALGVTQQEKTRLFVSTPPSFRRPQSVLVAPLPAVAPSPAPIISPTGGGALCAKHLPLVAGFTGAPLLYATAYAHDMRFRVKLRDGSTLDLPASADPVRGGYVVDAGSDLEQVAQASEGTLHGLWGFAPFDGPRYTMVAPNIDWQVADHASLVVGRDSPLPLEDGAAACVTGVWLELGADRRAAAWTNSGEHGIIVQAPLADVTPGSVTLLLQSEGRTEPQRLTVRTFSEPSRLSAFTVYAGERTGILTGSRLDQVASLELRGGMWRPDALGRVRSTDQLDLTADASVAGPATADGEKAKVNLTDGRQTTVKVVVASARSAAALVSMTVERVGPAPRLPIVIAGTGAFPADARVTFSIRAPVGTRFAADDQVEIASKGSAARVPIRPQDERIAIAEVTPATALGTGGYGPLQFRLIKNGVAGDWRPLGTAVRLPIITAINCAEGAKRCLLRGESLFLLQSVGANGPGDTQVPVPDGFTGREIGVPNSGGRALRVVLRDDPGARASISVAH